MSDSKFGQPTAVQNGMAADVQQGRSDGSSDEIVRELQKSRQALSDTEERYRALAEQMGDGVYISDSEGHYIDANDAACRMLGYTRDELLTLTLVDVLAPEEQARLPRQFEELSTGRFVRGDWRFRRKDGSYFIGEIVASQIPGGGYQGVVRDVTERREAEQKLRDLQEQQAYLLKLSDALRPLADAVQIQVTATTLLGQELKANRVAYVEINGEEGVVHRDYVDGVPSIAGRFRISDFGEHVLGMYRRGETVHIPDIAHDPALTPLARQSYAAINVASDLGCGLLKDGHFTAAIAAHQATPRKWTQREIWLLRQTAERTWDAVERARTEEALKNNQAMLQAFYDSAPFMMGVSELGESGTICISGNEDLARQTHTPIESLPGKTGIELGSTPAIEQQWIENVHRSQREGKPAQFEYHRSGLDGGRWLAATVSAIGSGPGGRPRFSFVVQDVTERKRIEETARSERELLDIIIGHMPAAVCLIGSDLCVQIVNPAYQQIAPGKAMAGKTLDELWPEAGEDLTALCRRVLETGQPHLVENGLYQIRRSPGAPTEEGYFSWSLHRVRLPGEGGWGILNSAWETTARVKAEEALRDSEATLRAFYDNSPLYMGVTELAGDDVLHIYDNRASCDFFGVRAGQSGGKLAIAQLHAPRDVVSLWIENYRSSEEHAAPVHFEYNRVGRNGRRWLSVTVAPIGKSGDGRTRFCYVAEDVTDRNEALEALRASEERFRMLADNMSQLAWITDADGGVTWFNKRWYEYTGATHAEMEGWGWQKAHHPDHVERVLKHKRECIEKGEMWEDTFPLRSKSGEYRWFLARAVPIRDEGGRIVRWFGTNTDLTEQLETERQLRKANEDLEQFAYSASHDLQEPLRNVSLYSQLFARRYQGSIDAQADTYLRFIVDGAQRMSALISDLLAYTRAGSDHDAPVKLTDAERIFKEVISAMASTVAENQAIITHDALPALYARSSHLQQLFQNLIGNAVKYRRESDQPRIHVGAERSGAEWKFSVADNGIGIAPEYHSKVFGMFKRLHTERKYTGTGIGLAICKRIVEQYSGRIWLESQPGIGSKFYFTLPAEPKR